MQRNPSYHMTIDRCIMQTIIKKQPRTVYQLIRLVQPAYPIFSEQEIVEHILCLQKQRKLILKENPASPPSTLKGYLFSLKATWYWTIIILSFVTTTIIFTIPEGAYPIKYVRYLLGSLFVLFLPGYTFIKALFPTKDIDNIERTALSIGMSLTLVPITGLLLNYTPWGIRTTSITLSLLFLTIILTATAVIREYQALR